MSIYSWWLVTTDINDTETTFTFLKDYLMFVLVLKLGIAVKILILNGIQMFDSNRYYEVENIEKDHSPLAKQASYRRAARY